jgi:hypothetical protein
MSVHADPARAFARTTPAPPRTAGASALVASPAVQRLEKTSRALNARPEVVAQRALGETLSAASTAQRVANRTGLPDALKAGVETLSGMSMDDVRVHRNSGQPAQLQAHAYARGTDIHLAPGQERHLPHEAWHVAQQKQGRVTPTMQMKGVSINDDVALEREADVMGARAAQLRAAGAPASAAAAHTAAPAPLSMVSQARPVVQAVLEGWEIRDLKADAQSLKGASNLSGIDAKVDRMIDNGSQAGLSYAELMYLVRGLFRWARFGGTRDFAENAIAKLSAAAAADKFEQDYAEISNALARGSDAGFVADGELRPGVVIPNAVKDKTYDLGEGVKVAINPVEEADALYHSPDGRVHLEEVKNTPQAFFEKLRETPEQFQRMIDWRNGNAEHRVATVRIRRGTGLNALNTNERYQEAGLRQKIGELLQSGLRIFVAGEPIEEALGKLAK